MMILGWRLHHISGSVEAGYVHISSSAFREALARIKRIIGATYAWPLPTLQPCYVCTVYTLHSVYDIYMKWPMCTFYQTFEVDNASIQCCVHNLLMVQCPWYAGTPCTVDWFTSPGAPFTGSLFSPHMTDCEHINTLIHVTWNTECLKVHEKLHII